jgi:hypothetical protein
VGKFGAPDDRWQLFEVPLSLGERILALVESGGRAAPVTPLLVTLFINSAVRRVNDGSSLEGMPQAIPEVFVDYLRRVNSESAKKDGPLADEKFVQAAQIVAGVSLTGWLEL